MSLVVPALFFTAVPTQNTKNDLPEMKEWILIFKEKYKNI